MLIDLDLLGIIPFLFRYQNVRVICEFYFKYEREFDSTINLLDNLFIPNIMNYAGDCPIFTSGKCICNVLMVWLK